MSDLPKRVHLMEVGPRDGLQIEPKILSTAEKLELIGMIEDAGVTEIEVGSFVNPKAVPTMADTSEVFAGIARKPGVIYRGLSLNTKGVERAMATPNIDLDGRLHVTCSEVFVKRNTNRSIDDTLQQLPEWISLYKRAKVPTDGVTMMAVFGCNFEGDIPVSRVTDLLARTEDILAAHGETLKFANLCDTMGWANPEQIKRVVGTVRNRWPKLKVKLHLHDTRGLAMANAYAGLEMGIDEFDGSIGALGGCPFAGHKGAAGNICTEDLAFMCEEMGIATGIDVDKLCAAARRAEQMVGHPVPGKVMKGGSLKEKRKRS